MKMFQKPINRFAQKIDTLLKKAIMTEHTFMIIVALIIGVLGGYGAVAVRIMIHSVSNFCFPGTENLLANIKLQTPALKIIVPALGGLIVGPIIYFFAKEAKGHGVPEVMQAILLKGGIIRARVAIVKAITSVITISTGGSVGREGPIVQIGSSIGSAIGQFFHLSQRRMRTLVGCGAAAGIAAAFNTPIAGVLFAVEIILQDFAFAQFSPIVISSVIATVISHSYEGNSPAFPVPAFDPYQPPELLFYFGLAILCAIVAYLFIKILYFSEDFFDEKLKIPDYLKPVIGGTLIGIMALKFPEVMGVGYESIEAALRGETVWFIAIMLVLVKIVATSLTLGSGGSGGIFAPSLFLGAMTGVFFGGVAKMFFPEIVSSPGAYALVAMGGLVAATTHAPITAIIIVFELTKEIHIILPLMITCIISTIISTKFSRESIYTLKLLNRGIHLKDGAEINIMKSISVKDVYTADFDIIQETEPFDTVVNKVIAGREQYFPVVNKKQQLIGLITLNNLKEHLYARDMLRDLLIASDVSTKEFETVNPEDNCQTVLDKMTSSGLQGIPVIDSNKKNKLLGMVWRKDIQDAYNREIEARDVTSSFASKITMKNIDSSVHFMEGYSMTEIPVPKQFLGKTIKDLNIRAKYGIDILLIRNNSEQGSKIKAMPTPGYVFSFDDSIVISGEIGKINQIKSL